MSKYILLVTKQLGEHIIVQEQEVFPFFPRTGCLCIIIFDLL